MSSFFDGGDDKYNPYFVQSGNRAHMAIDVIQSANLIIGYAETAAIAAAERALNYDLRPLIDPDDKIAAVHDANAMFLLAQNIRQYAERKITKGMRDEEAKENAARNTKDN